MADNRNISPPPDENNLWFSPAEQNAPSPEPEEPLWHAPAAEAPQPEAPEPAEGWYVPGAVSPPPDRATEQAGGEAVPEEEGGWHAPGAAVEPVAEEEGIWRVPPHAQAQNILAGVADTIEAPPVETGDAVVSEHPPVEGAAEAEAGAASVEEGEVITFAGAISPAPGEEEITPGEPVEETTSPAAVAAAKLAELEATPPPEATSPLGRLISRFDTVEAEVAHLRERYHNGELTHEQFQDELRKLMILDERGVWWMIGTESNTWYRYQSGEWIPAERPRLRQAGIPTETGVIPVAEAVPFGSTAFEPLTPGATRQTTIQLDENNMPIVRRVPVEDPQATVVGASAAHFDDTALAAGETIPRTTLAQAGEMTLPHQAVTPAGARIPAQPDYSRAAAAPPSELVLRAQEAQARRMQGCLIRAIVAAVLGALALALIVIVGAVLFYSSKVSQYDRQINELADLAGRFQTTRIFDAAGNLLNQINDPTGGTRISVPLEEISPFLLHASIAIENARFYQDPGWDAVSVVRGILQTVQEGEFARGTSTITQQLARALVIEPERRTEVSIGRKIDEIIIAAEIGRRYTKSEILELYLNEIYYGNLAYGAEAAARTYFGISARDLNLPQAAFLAGLVGAPATFDPVTNREAAFTRMDAIIDRMLAVGCITFEHTFTYNGITYGPNRPFCVTQDMVNAAVVQKAEVEIRTYTLPSNEAIYPHFVNYVASQLEENYGLTDIYRAGFNVYTTIRPDIQNAAQQAVTDQLAQLQARGIGGNNASVVVMDPRNGYILAMVGSADYHNTAIDGQVNVAFTPQQPGSAIKPLVYVTAFQTNPQGQYWTPATIIWDVPTCWGSYCPRNYDGAFHGPQAVRYALANSYNIPAVKAMEYVTPDRFATTAQAMGLTFPGNTPQEAGLPGAIGAFDVRLYDMVVAFGVFANNGQRVDPVAITRITDNAGHEIPLPQRPTPVQVIQPEHAYLINAILSDDVARSAAFGRNSILNIPGYTAAVKTGTTNDSRDNWTIGYTPSLVVGVWHGNTDNSPMRGTSGITGAAPIWNAVMQAALRVIQPQNMEFPVPPGIVTQEICADTGTLPDDRCLNRRIEYFAAAQPPPAAGEGITRTVRVSTLTGLLANDFCPNFTTERTFLNISDAAAFEWINNTQAGRQWATERGIPLPALPVPTQACTASTTQPIFSLDWPIPNAVVQGLVEVRGRVQVFNFSRYQIEYGIGQQPQNFTTIAGPYMIQHPNSELLGSWDVSQYPDGPYTLRLSVFTNDGGYAVIDHVVMVDNPVATATFTPPTLTPTTPPIVITLTPTPFVVTLTPTPTLMATALPPYLPGTEITVSYGSIAIGTVNSAQLATYYRFDGQAGQVIRVAVTTTSGNLDGLVYLMDVSGQIISADDDSGGDRNPLLQVQLPFTGPYLIAVTRYDIGAGTTEGQYQMMLTLAQESGGGPASQTLTTVLGTRDPAQDILVQYGMEKGGTISGAQPVVYYQFEGQTGDIVEIAMNAVSGDLDTVLLLADLDGVILAQDDDGGEGTNSLLQFTLPQAGRYIIAATRFNYVGGVSTGDFRLTINRR